MGKIEEMLEARQAPGLKGVSSGPGSGARDGVRFDVVQPYKEVKRCLSAMEDAGRLKDPRAMRAAEVKFAEVKAKEGQRHDYNEKGHPIHGN